jgi:hypothetical protein
LNKIAQIAAFALVHANMDDRKDLTSHDVLTGIYVFSAERFYQKSGNQETVDRVISGLCDLEEPLWFLRNRYFSELYSGRSGMRAIGGGDDQFSRLLREPNLRSSDDPIGNLFTKLCTLDDNLGAALRKEGVLF